SASTTAPSFLPRLRATLVAPTLPLPTWRTSTPRRRPRSNPKGTDPRRYAPAARAMASEVPDTQASYPGYGAGAMWRIESFSPRGYVRRGPGARGARGGFTPARRSEQRMAAYAKQGPHSLDATTIDERGTRPGPG